MGLLAFTEKKEGAIATDGLVESECLKSNCDGLCLLKQEKVFFFTSGYLIFYFSYLLNLCSNFLPSYILF